MSGKLLRVTVVLHRHELAPGPDPALEELLVGSLAVPARPAQWVRQHLLPGLDPLVSDVLLCYPGTPGRP